MDMGKREEDGEEREEEEVKGRRWLEKGEGDGWKGDEDERDRVRARTFLNQKSISSASFQLSRKKKSNFSVSRPA